MSLDAPTAIAPSRRIWSEEGFRTDPWRAVRDAADWSPVETRSFR